LIAVQSIPRGRPWDSAHTDRWINEGEFGVMRNIPYGAIYVMCGTLRRGALHALGEREKAKEARFYWREQKKILGAGQFRLNRRQ